MVKSAATKHAAADPSVLTKYNAPTARPTLPERRTNCAARRGKVAPIRMVGTSTRANDKRPVWTGGEPAVNVATQRNNGSETAPYAALPTSTAPNTSKSGTNGLFERPPPARLPTPSPSMKALTTTVTDSMLTP